MSTSPSSETPPSLHASERHHSTTADDARISIVAGEVRKRFSTISMLEMLQVMQVLLTDPRLSEEALTSRGLQHHSPSQMSPASEGLHYHPSLDSSVTASELSPPDDQLSSVGGGGQNAAGVTATASPCSRRWLDAIAHLLDAARLSRQSDEEGTLSVVDRVQASMEEWDRDANGRSRNSLRLDPAPSVHALPCPELRHMVEELRQLSEELCYRQYHAVYEHLSAMADEDNDDDNATPCAKSAALARDTECTPSHSSTRPRRSAYRGTSKAVGIPPYSIAVEVSCPATASVATDSTDAREDMIFVIGCEYFQWEFLLQCPLACSCAPYPESSTTASPEELASVTAAQQEWRQRNSLVRFLYPTATNLSTCTSATSEVTSAEAEYELGAPQTVRTSLLGVAMRIWSQHQPHLVAQVLQLDEDTYPQHLYDGLSFWHAWPFNGLDVMKQCECAPSGEAMPIPLLPGECFTHESMSGDYETD